MWEERRVQEEIPKEKSLNQLRSIITNNELEECSNKTKVISKNKTQVNTQNKENHIRNKEQCLAQYKEYRIKHKNDIRKK